MFKTALTEFFDGRVACHRLEATLKNAWRTSGGCGDVRELDWRFRVLSDVFSGEGYDTRRADEIERREPFDNSGHAVAQNDRLPWCAMHERIQELR